MGSRTQRFENLSDRERADRYGEYLTDLVATLKVEMGWNTSDIIAKSRTGRTTVYRWLGADLSGGMPKAQAVREFHENLNLDPDHALQLLGYSVPRTVTLPPDALQIADPQVRDYVREVVRRLAEDGLTAAEVYHLKATLAQLAKRPTPPPPVSVSPETRSRRDLNAG